MAKTTAHALNWTDLVKFLAHRGHWLHRNEANTAQAFERAWSDGFGIETDIRDHDGEVVVSHDPPRNDATTLRTFLQSYVDKGADTILALNIKSDGLQQAVAAQLAEYQVQNYFVFDMSVPDSLHYIRADLRTFVRLSEYETEGPLLERAPGVWLDAFEGQWWTLSLVRSLVDRNKQVAIVSPELHGRPYHELWQALKTLEPAIKQHILLCTDHPGEASQFFAG
jgi:glycerophosphoryl diester phosphodiesterase